MTALLDTETKLAVRKINNQIRAQGYAAHPNPAMPPYVVDTQAYRLYMAGWWAAYYECEPLYKTCAACGGPHHIVRCPEIGALLFRKEGGNGRGRVHSK